MAKSDCGLPANSHATQRCISREEEDLNWMFALGKIDMKEWKRRRKRLKAEGKLRKIR